MFEDFTQNNLLKLALEKGKELDVSVIEGSLCYNSAALLSVMLEDLADEAERVYINSFPDTCDREHLIKFAERRGIEPEQATASQVKIESNIDLPVGTELSGTAYNFTVKESLSYDESEKVYYSMAECTTLGVVNLENKENVSPVEYIDGFSNGTIVSILRQGTEEESTESLRERYFEAVDVLPMAGNKAYYKKYLKEKFPEMIYTMVTYEAPNVILTVSDGISYKISQEKLDEIAKVMGKAGDGYAPINHLVTVNAATVASADVSFDLSLKEGAVKADVEAAIRKNVEKQFDEFNEKFGEEKTRTIRISKLINAAVSVEDVEDCTKVTIAEGSSNFIIGSDVIIKLGDIVWNY